MPGYSSFKVSETPRCELVIPTVILSKLVKLFVFNVKSVKGMSIILSVTSMSLPFSLFIALPNGITKSYSGLSNACFKSVSIISLYMTCKEASFAASFIKSMPIPVIIPSSSI